MSTFVHVKACTKGTKQRGFWLRCFLSATIWIFVATWTTCAVPVKAQIEVRTVHLPRVHGSVTDTTGKPIVHAKVDLVNATNQATIRETDTDLSGRFTLDCDHGSYWIRIKATGFAPAGEHVIVTSNLSTIFHTSWLYVMLGPGSCMDECSPIYTSKKQFDKAVLWNTGHYY